MWRAIAIALALTAAVGCSSGPSRTDSLSSHRTKTVVWTPPPDSTRSLVAEFSSERSAEGALVFHGRVLLPPGTVLWLILKPPGRKPFEPAKVSLGADGGFTSEAITDNGALLRPGGYKVVVLSWFNGAWQSPEVMSLVGEDGEKLPKRPLTPVDKEFPLAAGRLEETRAFILPDLSPERMAIEAVKNARLSTPENGRSADPVRGVVAYFESVYANTDPDNTRATGWSAHQGPDGKWTVTMDYLDAHKPKQAHWEYDPSTKHVRYLDPEAKMFSWTPKE